MKQQRGFTLVEILIVIAIVGVIAAFGYPSYTEQMKKSRRAEAKVALVELAQLQEAFYADNNSYTGTLNTGGLACVGRGICILDGTTIRTPEAYYTLTATGTTRAYTLTATVNSAGDQKNDPECNTFSLNQRNQRSASNAAAVDTSAICW